MSAMRIKNGNVYNYTKKEKTAEKQEENVYARKIFPPIKIRSEGPTFRVYDQMEVELDCKDPQYIHVWVDGGGNFGPASLGVVVVDKGTIIMTFGAFLGKNLTNNIAELNAILKGLRLVKHLWKPVRIYSDSQYAINSICGIFHGRKNKELIDNIIEYAKQYPVPIEFVKVQGHTNLIYNEMADGIASTLLQQGRKLKYKQRKKKSK